MSLPGSFVSTSAGRIFVHRGGAGSPLLLVHGWMMSHFYFRPVIEQLETEHEVIALDLPGYGESDNPSPARFAYEMPAFADVVDEVLSALSLNGLDVLGASMGGGVSLALAARHPERVQRLVLVGAAAYAPPILPLEARLALVPRAGELAFRHLFGKREFAQGNRTRAVRDGSVLDDAWVDYYWDRLNRAGGKDAAYASMVHLCTLPPVNEDAAHVTQPTLLVWGDEDRLVPLARGKQLQRAMPNARLEVVPACGHMPFIERPAEFLRLVRRFLAEPVVAGSPRRVHSVG